MITAALAGLVAAASVPDAPTGLHLTVAGWLVAVPVLVLGWSTRSRLARGLGLLAPALMAVPALRASDWLAAICLLAGLGLLAYWALEVRTWPWLVLAGPALGVALFRAVGWLARGVAPRRVRRLTSLGVGLLVSTLVVLPVAALLAGADPAFEHVLDLALPELGSLPQRTLLLVFAGGLALATGFAACTRPRWPRLVSLGAPRPAAEWALPLVLLDLLLAAFIAVQASVLFGGDELVRQAGVTYAGRAREGFGQLVAATVLVLALLAWSGWAAGGGVRTRQRAVRDRRLSVLGGALCALTLLLTASALRRLWLYEQAYGWTVTRIVAGWFEIWLAVVVLLVAVLWATFRGSWTPRAVMGSAAAGLLALALAGPDALAAQGNVERYRRTGSIDVAYLSRLSDDAVPALRSLPEPARGQVLSRADSAPAPWYAVNLSRLLSR